MKDKKIPLIMFGLLLLCLSFALGYIVGNGNGKTVIAVSTQAPEAAVHNEQPQKSELQESKPQSDADGLIDLNTADQAELETLPGIGPELAGRILTYREENGPFIAKEQLMDVEGIGEGRYEKLEARITIGGTP